MKLGHSSESFSVNMILWVLLPLNILRIIPMADIITLLLQTINHKLTVWHKKGDIDKVQRIFEKLIIRYWTKDCW